MIYEEKILSPLVNQEEEPEEPTEETGEPTEETPGEPSGEEIKEGEAEAIE